MNTDEMMTKETRSTPPIPAPDDFKGQVKFPPLRVSFLKLQDLGNTWNRDPSQRNAAAAAISHSILLRKFQLAFVMPDIG